MAGPESTTAEKSQTTPEQAGARGAGSASSPVGVSSLKAAASLAQGYDAQVQLLSPVQRRGGGTGADVKAAAAHGTSGGGGAVPFGDRIQKSFGGYDISNVQAYSGAAATEANAAMGAEAYATGNRIAFGGTPDLHTTAHELTHVVQQRAGVSLSGGVGKAGDAYEQHADRVADAVVQGKSAEPLLAELAGDRGQAGGEVQQRAVQRKEETPVPTQSPTPDAPIEIGASEDIKRMATLPPVTSLNELFILAALEGQRLLQVMDQKATAAAAGASQDVTNLVGGAVTAMTPEDTSAVLEAEGKINVGDGAFETTGKLSLELKDKPGSKIEMSGKFEFGNAAKIGMGWFAPFFPPIKLATAGSYEVKATGDSANECLHLMKLAVQLSMQSAASGVQEADDAQKAAAEAEKDNPGVLKRLGSWLGFVIQKGAQAVKTAVRALFFPGDTAQWSMEKFLALIWHGDMDLSFDESLRQAVEAMDAEDQAEVTREGAGSAGLAVSGGVLGNEGEAEVSIGTKRETKTTLDKDAMSARNAAPEVTDKRVIAAKGKLSLKSIGLEGELEYKNERKLGDKSPAEGELAAKLTLSTGLTQAAAGFAAIQVLSKVGKWLEDGEKDQPKDGKTPSPTKGVFADAFIGLQSFNLMAIARNAATKPGEDAEVSVALTWKHSPWYHAKTEITAVHVLKGETGILGSKMEASLKSGMKMSREQEAPEKPFDLATANMEELYSGPNSDHTGFKVPRK